MKSAGQKEGVKVIHTGTVFVGEVVSHEAPIIPLVEKNTADESAD